MTVNLDPARLVRVAEGLLAEAAILRVVGFSAGWCGLLVEAAAVLNALAAALVTSDEVLAAVRRALRKKGAS